MLQRNLSLLIILSEDKNHDSKALKHYVSLMNDHLRDRGVALDHEIMWPDGCSSHFKSKQPFSNVADSHIDDVPLEKYFFGSRHGKGPCDGEVDTVK